MTNEHGANEDSVLIKTSTAQPGGRWWVVCHRPVQRQLMGTTQPPSPEVTSGSTRNRFSKLPVSTLKWLLQTICPVGHSHFHGAESQMGVGWSLQIPWSSQER